MKNTGYMNGESEQGEDINLIVTKVCDFYLKEINSSIVDL